MLITKLGSFVSCRALSSSYRPALLRLSTTRTRIKSFDHVKAAAPCQLFSTLQPSLTKFIQFEPHTELSDSVVQSPSRFQVPMFQSRFLMYLKSNCPHYSRFNICPQVVLVQTARCHRSRTAKETCPRWSRTTSKTMPSW